MSAPVTTIGLTLNLAFNYGGRDEILRAIRRIVVDGVPAEQIDEVLFGLYLDTAGLPDPDLIVRTGGEMRISNFLVWQSVLCGVLRDADLFGPILIEKSCTRRLSISTSANGALV